jgi:tetratricopeptide (TPR) repeat protein
MRKLSSVSYCLLFLLIFASTQFAQDMKPDAAKLYNSGNKMLKSGNYNGAVDDYNKALNIEKDFRIYYQKGIALKNSRKLQEAKDSFENCLKMKSDFAAAYNALGGVYFSMGNYELAAQNFEKILEITNNDRYKAKVKTNLALAYTKLGTSAMNDGNSAKAIDYLKKAVSNSNYDAAYLALAKIYSEVGNYDACLSAAQNALKYRKSIGSGGPYYYMGIAYKNKGDVEKAKEMLTHAKKDATYRKTAEYELTALK